MGEGGKMSKKPDGGPAFPVDSGRLGVFTGKVEDTAGTGMTLRDYFAGKVLAGAISCRADNNGGFAAALAEECYRVADAMIAARDR
jgi:hypothetical protein